MIHTNLINLQKIMMADEKKYKIYFAPLQGFTDAIYRNAHEVFWGGIDSYYAPFIRLEKGDNFRNKEIRDIDKNNNAVKHLVPQLIANKPDELRKIAKLISEKGYTEVNINLGCPFPVLARRHKGSGILPYPNEVRDLLNTINEFPNIFFSVKMRLGWENMEECMALIPLLNALPFSEITLHPRLGIQQYKGTTDINAFELFYNECKHPLIYNGDIKTLEDIEIITTRFPKLAGIMIGRGLLENPALAMEYKQNRALTFDEKAKKIKGLHTSMLESYQKQLQGEAQLLNKMKTLWEYLLPEIEKKYRKKISKSTKMETYLAAVNEALRHQSNEY